MVRYRKLIFVLVVCMMIVLGLRLLTADNPTLVEQKPFFVMYFPSATLDKLEVDLHEGDGSIQQRIAVMQSGPREEGLLPLLPEGTKILDYYMQEAVLFVSFSEQLVLNHPGGSFGELITVYGIVNSLSELADVEMVKILVEGKEIPTLAGHVHLLDPLEKDLSLVGNSSL